MGVFLIKMLSDDFWSFQVFIFFDYIKETCYNYQIIAQINKEKS